MIARTLLKYECVYTGLDKSVNNGYDTYSKKEPINLKKVYITNDMTQLFQNYMNVPAGDMILFYDKTYSQPNNLTFDEDETIDFDNLTYQIVKVHKAPFGNHVELTLERING